MKTPDEIKKGLECCATVKVGGVCPFDCPLQPLCASGDDGAVQREILALIQQLQAQNAEQAERIHQLEAERDAAVEELSEKTELAKTLKMKFDQLVKEWRELEKMLRRGVQKEVEADG